MNVAKSVNIVLPVIAPKVNHVVYISYLDEAGLSNDETHLVVAGILVKDDQIKPCEHELESILKKHIPEDDQDGFEFHAHHLFTGSRYFSNKSAWPWAKRQSIIKEVLDILINHSLPISFGAINKARLKQKYREPFNPHDLAFMFFAERMNRLVANRKNDICLLIADETTRKKIIKSSLREYRKMKIPLGDLDERLDNIADTILFADSRDSWGLQVADFCNYFIKRHLIGGNDNAEALYQRFGGQIKNSRVFPD